MKKPDSNDKAWLAKAANDMLNIENNVAADNIPWDTVYFHAQQAAEKTIKAYLAYHSLPITRTHDLVALLSKATEIESSLKQLTGVCQRLNYYAVSSRYPDDLYEPDEKEGKEMVIISQEIQETVKEFLP